MAARPRVCALVQRSAAEAAKTSAKEVKKGGGEKYKLSLVVAVDAQRGIGLRGTLPWLAAAPRRASRRPEEEGGRGQDEGTNQGEEGNPEGAIHGSLRADMAHFVAVTGAVSSAPGAANAVVMGRATYLSIPPRFRPLKGRLNVVLTSNAERFAEELGAELSAGEEEADPLSVVHASPDLESALAHVAAHKHPIIENVFVIGGAQLFADCLKDSRTETVHLTEIDAEFGCDRFLADVPDTFRAAETGAWQEERGLRFRFVRLVREDSPV
jgi:dihydrofolate reductase